MLNAVQEKAGGLTSTSSCIFVECSCGFSLGLSNGSSDPTEIVKLQQEIETQKRHIQDSNQQIEKLVS